MVKRALVPFLTVLVVWSTAWSDGTTTFKVNPSASVGPATQPIDFLVHVSTTEDIGALLFTLEYDSTIATFSTATLHSSMPSGFAVVGVNPDLPPPGPYSPGTNENVLVYITGNGISDSFTGEQDVAIMTFQFKPGVCGSSPINFDPTCARTQLATLQLISICDPGLVGGAIATDCATDTPVRHPGGKQQLFDSVPNPFNPSTMIRFEVASEAQAQLRVFDVSGRTVRVLVNDRVAAGPHDVRWNGRDDSGHILPSGVYYYELVTPFGRDTKRTLLLK